MTSTWPHVCFGDALADVSKVAPIRLASRDYLKSGSIPIIDQGAKPIAGYSNRPEDAVKVTKPVIIFGDHTKIIKLVTSDFCVGAEGVKILEPRPDFDARFLFHFLSTIALPDAGYSRHFKFLQRVTVPKPPLDEQRRIAAILDQADEISRKRHLALETLNILPKAIFQEMFGHPFRNTKHLPLASLSTLGTWHSGGTPPRKRRDFFDGKVAWFSSGELNHMMVYESVESISEIALEQSSAKRVTKGSIMLGMYDTAALKASIAGVDCSCNQAIAFARLNDDIVETVYVYYAIIIGRDDFRRQRRGIRQKNLNLQLIRDITIPLPPLADQRRFVDKVHNVKELSKLLEAFLSTANQLFAAMQHREFIRTPSPPARIEAIL